MGWIIDLLKDVPLSTVIKEKLIDAEKKISVLEQQNKYFQTSLDQATKEIQRLNEIINVFQKNQRIKKYDEITEKVLKLFFEAGRELSIYDFVRTLSLDVSTIRYHFDLLSKDDLIIQTKYGTESSWSGENSPDLYDLTPRGRKYIVESKESCPVRPIPAYKAGLYGLTETRQLSNSNSKPPFIPVRRTGFSGCSNKLT